MCFCVSESDLLQARQPGELLPEKDGAVRLQECELRPP